MTTAAIAVPVSTPSAKRKLRWRLPFAFVLLLVVIALLAPWLAPHTPYQPSNYDDVLNHPPSALHPFGTDGLGRDVLSNVIYGARTSLSLAFASVSLALLLGTLYGAAAGMLGGVVDRVLMRFLDVALSIPRLLLLLAVTAFWNSLGLGALIVLLGATGWFDVARLVRGEVQSLEQREFVLAARATGVGRLRLLSRHLLPHLIPLLIVSATLNIASTIALEAGLSYLGLGLEPSTPSWGRILHNAAGPLDAHWWLTLFPGLALVAAVLACHTLGDALRELFSMDQVPA